MATTVVFVGAGGGVRSTVKLDMEADEVGKRLREATTFERFEVKGKSVWINPANVLYLEQKSRAVSL